jgi:hypothetical protein
MTLTVFDLFSGIGGFSLGLERAGVFEGAWAGCWGWSARVCLKVLGLESACLKVLVLVCN